MDRKVVIMDHPLIQHKLSILRDVDTSTMEFRELVNEIAMLMRLRQRLESTQIRIFVYEVGFFIHCSRA